jgi:hypothetical protein
VFLPVFWDTGTMHNRVVFLLWLSSSQSNHRKCRHVVEELRVDRFDGVDHGYVAVIGGQMFSAQKRIGSKELSRRRCRNKRVLENYQQKWCGQQLSKGWKCAGSFVMRWELDLPVSSHELLELSKGPLGELIGKEKLAEALKS